MRMERLIKILESRGYDSFPPYGDQLDGIIFDFFRVKERITIVRDKYTSFQVFATINDVMK